MSDDLAERGLDVALSVAAEVSELLREGYRSGVTARKKGPIDLVTEYDLAAEKLIRARLAAAFPDHRIVGEEGEAQGEGETVWYVDPLDGTTNFAHGHPFYCVSIALWHEGAGLVGVVAAPTLGVTWSARRGGGAERCDAGGAAPCRVSGVTELSDALCATGFPYDKWTNDDDNTRELRAFLKRTHGVRRCGSAAMDLALVADGTYDLYWEGRLNAWDMCAGAVLVAEAGGQLSDLAGGRADARSGQILATNGALHGAALGILRSCRNGD